MKIVHIKTSILIYIILWVPLLIFSSVSKANSMGNNNKSQQCIFYYPKNSILLLPEYKDNAVQLRALAQLIKQHQTDIGHYYFSIVSHVRQEEAHNPEALNQASLQGSVLRAYIRTHFRLPAEQFTFQIDTLHPESNLTSVQLLPLPVPANLSAIHYSLSRNPGEIAQALSRYRRIPYVESHHHPKITKNSGLPSSLYTIIMENVQKTDSLSRVIRQLTKENQQNQHLIDSIQQSDSIFLYKEVPEFSKGYSTPFMGIKTNLMYWAGFTPEMSRRQILPNLSLEFYLSRHWSLQFDGAYTRRLINGERAKRYAFTSFGVESRYWLCGNYRFNGFYLGVYSNGGEFDITPKYTADAKGHTGEYIGGGLSVGYAQSICNWFALEAGIRGCFRHVSYDTYHRTDSHYYYESTKYKNGVRLDGVFLNMVFRLEKYRK